MSKFEPISTTLHIKKLSEEDPCNVGVSPSGDLYVWDFEKDHHKKLTPEEAGELLNLSPEIMAEVVKSGGHFEVPVVIENTSGNEDDNPGNEQKVVVHEEAHGDGEQKNEVHENKVVKKGLEVEIKLDPKQVEELLTLIKELKEEVEGFKSQLEAQKELSGSRHNEFIEFKNEIMIK